MKQHAITCRDCGKRMRMSKITLDTSGANFRLTIGGIPLFACDKCHLPLHFNDSGPTPDDVIITVLHALDRLTPSSYSAPVHTQNQCRSCKADLGRAGGAKKMILKVTGHLPQGVDNIVVQYTGPVVECPDCGALHPVLTPVTYHEISAGIHRDSAIYVRQWE